MAKQAGILKLSGTLYGITFYQLYGRYYMRRKTCIDKARVMQDAAFANSRKRMAEFGAASKFCAAIYRGLPAQFKGKGIQQKMSGRAYRMFLESKSEEEVRRVLEREFGGV